MNKAFLSGHLTRDPETRVTQDGQTTITRFSIAVDRNREEADFLNVTTFGKTAEFAEKYLRKGQKVIVEGRIRAEQYTDRDGQVGRVHLPARVKSRSSEVQILGRGRAFLLSKNPI